MRKQIQIFSFFLMAGLFVCVYYCSSQTSKQGIERLSNEKFRKEAKKSNTVIVDVRTPDEYREGHIAGAVLMDYLDTENFVKQLVALDPSKHYLLYCRAGKRSMNAANLMKSKGFKKVSDLRDGISEWDGPKVTDKK